MEVVIEVSEPVALLLLGPSVCTDEVACLLHVDLRIKSGEEPTLVVIRLIVAVLSAQVWRADSISEQLVVSDAVHVLEAVGRS